MVSQNAKLLFDGDKSVFVEITQLPEEREVSLSELTLRFSKISELIEETACGIKDALKNINLKKTKVEFGVSMGAETGELISFIAKGSGEATLRITLEW